MLDIDNRIRTNCLCEGLLTTLGQVDCSHHCYVGNIAAKRLNSLTHSHLPAVVFHPLFNQVFAFLCLKIFKGTASTPLFLHAVCVYSVLFHKWKYHLHVNFIKHSVDFACSRSALSYLSNLQWR